MALQVIAKFYKVFKAVSRLELKALSLKKDFLVCS